jgi:hypothetical protein
MTFRSGCSAEMIPGAMLANEGAISESLERGLSGTVAQMNIVPSAATVTSFIAARSSGAACDFSSAISVTPSVWPQSLASNVPSSEYMRTDLSLPATPATIGDPAVEGRWTRLDMITASPPSVSPALKHEVTRPVRVLTSWIVRSVADIRRVSSNRDILKHVGELLSVIVLVMMKSGGPDPCCLAASRTTTDLSAEHDSNCSPFLANRTQVTAPACSSSVCKSSRLPKLHVKS